MSSSNCCFLTCIQVSQEAGQEVVRLLIITVSGRAKIRLHALKNYARGTPRPSSGNTFHMELACIQPLLHQVSFPSLGLPVASLGLPSSVLMTLGSDPVQLWNWGMLGPIPTSPRKLGITKVTDTQLESSKTLKEKEQRVLEGLDCSKIGRTWAQILRRSQHLWSATSTHHR